MGNIYMPKTGCRENSKIDKTLDFIASKGIDCIRLPGIKRLYRTTFYPINTLDGENFIYAIWNNGGRIITDDFMTIDVEEMNGEEIMKLDTTLKLKNDVMHDLILIGYAKSKVHFNNSLILRSIPAGCHLVPATRGRSKPFDCWY
jgi:hypothetical protein